MRPWKRRPASTRVCPYRGGQRFESPQLHQEVRAFRHDFLRAFADDEHTLDFINKAFECLINKAFECLDVIGWEHAPALLPTVVGQMVAARGAEESTSWRQPVDLVAHPMRPQLEDVAEPGVADGFGSSGPSCLALRRSRGTTPLPSPMAHSGGCVG
jgi:hypothetical protein